MVLPSSSCCGFSSAETDGMEESSFGGSGSVMVVLADVGRVNGVLYMGKDEVLSGPRGDV
jgi:hypothetical protein